MGINIAELERQEAISFFMWVQSLNKTGFPKNGDGTMKDIWQLYDYWDSMDGMDKKAFWTHARTKEPKAAALLSGEDWISVGERLPEINEPLMAYNDDGVREVLIKNYVATVLAFDPAIGIFKAKIDRSHHWTEVSSVSSNGGVTPTHWQPLPEPPKP